MNRTFKPNVIAIIVASTFISTNSYASITANDIISIDNNSYEFQDGGDRHDTGFWGNYSYDSNRFSCLDQDSSKNNTWNVFLNELNKITTTSNLNLITLHTSTNPTKTIENIVDERICRLDWEECPVKIDSYETSDIKKFKDSFEKNIGLVNAKLTNKNALIYVHRNGYSDDYNNDLCHHNGNSCQDYVFDMSYKYVDIEASTSIVYCLDKSTINASSPTVYELMVENDFSSLSKFHSMLSSIGIKINAELYSETGAFRYLTSIFQYNPKTSKTIHFLTQEGNKFSSLYGMIEQEKIRKAIKELEQLTINEKAYPSSTKIFYNLLLNIYYDRAVAESILANQSIDQARIGWIEKGNRASIHINIAHRQDAINTLQAAIDDYWTLITNHRNSFKALVPQRGLTSPHYINRNGNLQPVVNGEALFQGHKDTAMLYSLMNMLAEQKLAVAKLTIQSGETDQHAISNLQADLNTLNNELTAKDSTLKAIFGERELSEVTTASGLPEAMVKLETSLNAMKSAKNWLSGETNLLGLPQDSILLVQGYGIDGNTVFDSFNALKAMIAEPTAGVLAQAKEAQSEAFNQYNTYRHNRDQFRSNYQAISRSLNDQLFNLLGCTLESSNSDNCIVENSKRAGSQVAQQLLLITSAKQAIERAKLQHQNLLDAMTIENERLAEEKGISEALEKIIVQFGEQQLQLQKLINESNSSSIFNSKDIQSQLDTISNFINDKGLVKLDLVLAASRDFEAKLKGMNSEDAKNYAAALAALERASLMSTERGLLDANSRAHIRNLLLELKTAELDIARSMTTLAQEAERLTSMLNKAKRIKAQLKAHDTEQLDRYYADPLHFTRLTSHATKAEKAFENLQEWLFYAVGALEYKWQEPFADRSNGYNKASLFNLYTIEELNSYYTSLVHFDNARNLHSTQQAIDTFSLKKHFFSYFDEIQGKTQWYPAPSGSGEMLTADDAFKAKLSTMTRLLGTDTWLTVEFSTVKEIPRSNFFQGPVVASNKDLSCLADGGTYLDKIESISINLPTSYTVSGEETSPAYLTYGGNNYLRSKIPGELTDDGLGINDEIIAYSTRFWDRANGQLTFTNSFRQQMSANITQTYAPSLEMLNPTFSFKERSVAASGWRLSVKLSDRSGDIIDIDALNDIELLFKHRFKSRNFATCGGNNGGPLLLLK